MKRRTWLQGTLWASGGSSKTEEEAASALQDHWSQVFAATEDDESLWPELLSFVPKLPDVTEDVGENNLKEHGWMMEEDDWFVMIKGRKDSMPGEDGIPYSAWRARSAGDILYDCYRVFFF